MHHSKLRQWGAQLIVLDPVFTPVIHVSCLPVHLPWGQAMQLMLTAMTGVHLNWHFTNCQPQITELWAQLQVSAAWMKPGQSVVTQGCQQMFLPLTVADLTSHLTAGRALLGPWLQS